MKKLGIYIHIPFCIKKCGYCDFYSYEKVKKNYVNYLISEISIYLKKNFFKKYIIDSLYIGGGTPSILSYKDYSRLFSFLKKYLPLNKKIEITIEFNPEHINVETLTLFKSIGINRFSFGIQSTNKELLKIIGRGTIIKNYEYIVEKVRESNLPNISLDFLFAIPSQKEEDIIKDFNFIDEINPHHISWYQLTFYKNTHLYNKLKKGVIKYPEEENILKLSEFIKRELVKRGFHHYEVSNYAKKGFECLHNLKYWQLSYYLGFGESACGFYNRTFYENYRGKEYYNAIKNKIFPYKVKKVYSIDEYFFLQLMMGLRLKKGIKISSLVKNPLKNEKIKEFLNDDILLQKNGYLRISEKFFPLLDSILTEIM